MEDKNFVVKRIEVNRIVRRYFVHLPERYNTTKKYPVIVGFHGGYGNGLSFEKRTQFLKSLENRDVIYILPEGLKRFWADKSGAFRENENNKDVQYVQEILKETSKNYSVDQNKIFFAGYSRGASFIFRLACELPEKIAAIIAVGATLPKSLETNCKMHNPVSLILIHGDSDPVSPYGGGKFRNRNVDLPFSSGILLGVEKTVDLWAHKLGCKTSVETILGDVRKNSYEGCQSQTNLDIYVVKGMGHAWPPNERSFQFAYGKTTPYLSVNSIILEQIKR